MRNPKGETQQVQHDHIGAKGRVSQTATQKVTQNGSCSAQQPQIQSLQPLQQTNNHNIDNGQQQNCYLNQSCDFGMSNMPSSSYYNPALGVPGFHPSMNGQNMYRNQSFTPQYGTVNGNSGYRSYDVNTSTHNTDYNGDIAGMIMQMNNNFSSRLTMIENSLTKLGSIESDVTLVRADVSRIKTDNIEFNRRLIEVEVSCQSTVTPSTT